jgi:vancomycin resistance protein YoaR
VDADIVLNRTRRDPESRTLCPTPTLGRHLVATREYTTYDGISRAARRQKLRRRRRIRASALVAGVLLPATLGIHALATNGDVMSGTAVAGVDVGGMSRSAARARLVHDLGDRLSAPVTVRVGGTTAEVVPAELGIRLDATATVDRAFGAGRVEARLLPYMWSESVEPVLLYPKKLTLPKALAKLEQKPRNAKPVIQDDGTVGVVPAEDGLAYDDAAALRAIALAALQRDGVARLEPSLTKPAVPTAAAESTAADAERLLARSISLTYRGHTISKITPKELAPLLKVKRTGSSFALSIAPAGLRNALAKDVADISRPAVNAHWRTDGVRARVVKHKNGRGIDGQRTGNAMLAAVLTGNTHTAAVTLGPVTPSLTTGQARALGIRQKISSVTTDLGASSANRVYNVRLMARFLDGQIIKPGQTFSFNKRVGPRTPQRGFKEGQAIVGGLLLPSIGGGVCQVATTVYDAAFYAALPIKSRVNHSWYISHYAMGMDATVADGGPDLVFKNDSKYGFLIRASASASTMTVTLYSTDRGLRVEKVPGQPHSRTTPKARYILNPALKGAEKSQRTAGQGGFAITVERVVRKKGKVVSRDTFSSNYIAESQLFVVGPEFVPEDGATVETAPPAFTF